jgi:hypothetical protein
LKRVFFVVLRDAGMKKVVLLFGALVFVQPGFAMQYAVGLFQSVANSESLAAVKDKVVPRNIVGELQANGTSVVPRNRLNQEHRLNRIWAGNATDAGTEQLCEDIMEARGRGYPIGNTAIQIAVEHLRKVPQTDKVIEALDALSPEQLSLDLKSPTYNPTRVKLTNRLNLCLNSLAKKEDYQAILLTLGALEKRNNATAGDPEGKEEDEVRLIRKPIFLGPQDSEDILSLVAKQEERINQIKLLVGLLQSPNAPTVVVPTATRTRKSKGKKKKQREQLSPRFGARDVVSEQELEEAAAEAFNPEVDDQVVNVDEI